MASIRADLPATNEAIAQAPSLRGASPAKAGEASETHGREERRTMMINELSKRVIPFRPHDAKRVGEGCFYLDSIVWLNGNRIEMGDGVGFNVGCFVNGFGGLTIGDGTNFGPYSMIHTANHNMDDPDRPVTEQGWRDERPIEVGRNCWIGMSALILPGVRIGDGCVLGAGAVLTRDLDDYTIAVGNPARPIRSRR